MPKPAHRPKVVVLSPFVDKRHGTERCLAEQIERLSGDFEIHLYSSRVEDVDLSGTTWHRVPMPRGPHLFRYLWWLMANRFCRWWDSRFRGLAPTVVYSPGVNCMDADIVSVHVLFSNLRRQLKDELSLRGNPLSHWPVIVHRRIYYRLAEFLEHRVYGGKHAELLPVSERIGRDIAASYGRSARVRTVYYGVDSLTYSAERRVALRGPARAALGLPEDVFAILLIGNGWKNKGLPCLLEAAGRLQNLKLHLFVVGNDSVAPYKEQIHRLGLADRVSFLTPRPDVEFYYAAADAYASPSLEDSFSLPCIEAMSCGLPAITSQCAGVCEIMHHGEDGLILQDPADFRTLAEWLERLSRDVEWRRKMGENAARTAGKYTWGHNARQLGEVLNSIVRQRGAQ
jgi:glycosyltransferase involved in cell wall biosynthesis